MWWLVGLLGTALLGALVEREAELQRLREAVADRVVLDFGEELTLLPRQKALRADGSVLEGPLTIAAPSQPDEEIFVELAPGYVVSHRWER